MRLDHEKIINEKADKLNTLTDYIPLLLHQYLDNGYFNRATEEAKQQFYKQRTQLQREGDNFAEFLKKDLENWIKGHKEFEDIIIK